MPETPAQFHARVMAAADAEGRLPPMSESSEIFPYEENGLRTKPFEPPVLPEPPRSGEGDRPCFRCAIPDRGVLWSDDRWTFSGARSHGVTFWGTLEPKAHVDLGDLDDQHAAELGILIVRIERAIRALGDVGRVHVNKWGDGGAHLHITFLARPAGLLQLRGSCLADWLDVLPPVPQEILDADLAAVAAALAISPSRS
jgi:diadenosine tetraphosphate (Ap4A) HIT family hydrolase